MSHQYNTTATANKQPFLSSNIVIIALGLIVASISGGLASAFVVGTITLPTASQYAQKLSLDIDVPSQQQSAQRKHCESPSSLSPAASPKHLNLAPTAGEEQMENDIIRLTIQKEKLRRTQEENAQLRMMLQALQEIDGMAGSSSGEAVGFEYGSGFVWMAS